jgi:G3E family GTPase
MIVDILAGYLGAGKTSYINRILSHADDLWHSGSRQRLAILVNDFGEINIDRQRIVAQQGQMIDIAGGCICCTFGSDLVEGLQTVLARSAEFDRLMIECSGVALPGAVKGTVRLCMPDAVIKTTALIHVLRIEQQLDDQYIGDTVRLQLQQADAWLGTHADLIAGEAAETVFLDLIGKRLKRLLASKRVIELSLNKHRYHQHELSNPKPKWRSFMVEQRNVSSLDALKQRFMQWQHSNQDPERESQGKSRLERVKGYLLQGVDDYYWVEWANGRLTIEATPLIKSSDELGLVVIELLL